MRAFLALLPVLIVFGVGANFIIVMIAWCPVENGLLVPLTSARRVFAARCTLLALLGPALPLWLLARFVLRLWRDAFPPRPLTAAEDEARREVEDALRARPPEDL